MNLLGYSVEQIDCAERDVFVCQNGHYAQFCVATLSRRGHYYHKEAIPTQEDNECFEGLPSYSCDTTTLQPQGLLWAA
jgi:transketolase N-terminal domain/subunit